MNHPSCTQADLLAPYKHTAMLESKGIRTLLVDATNAWTLVPPRVQDAVKHVIGMLHNASLMVDDIEDGSDLRRGAPAAHKVYGVPRTLNCANQMYFEALKEALALPTLAITDSAVSCSPAMHSYYIANVADLTVQISTLFTEEMVELHEGQGMDIFWRDTCCCPTLEEYDEMVTKKTGGLFRLALRLMMVLAAPHSAVGIVHKANRENLLSSSQVSESSMFLSDEDLSLSPTRGVKMDGASMCAVGETTFSTPTPASAPTTPTASDTTQSPSKLPADLIRLFELLGVYFQVVDDLLNICSSEYHANKTFFEDITEGKFSYPVIHSLHASSQTAPNTPLQQTELFTILQERPTCNTRKLYCVLLLERTGSLLATRERAAVLEAEIRQHLDRLGGSSAIEDVLSKMNGLIA